MYTKEKAQSAVTKIKAVIKEAKNIRDYNYCLGFIDCLEKCGVVSESVYATLLNSLNYQKIDFEA